MPERPIIVFPAPTVASRAKLNGFGKPPHFPSRARQGQRLNPKFDTLKVYFERKAVELMGTAAGQVPEEVIVFETVGSITKFINATRHFPGLDFLAEWDAEDIVPDEDFYNEQRPEAELSGRVFLVMTNQQALQELLKLWQLYQRRGRAQFGLAKFFNLFEQLRDIRRWSPKDRLLETGVLEYWKEAAASGDRTPIPFEIELWFRKNAQQRAQSVERIRQIILRGQGQVVSVCEIEPICYHCVVAKLPVSQIKTLVQDESSDLLGDSSVLCFRPSGQNVIPSYGPPDLQAPTAPQPSSLPAGTPTVALFDGLPLQNHNRLAGRLTVDDPDGYAAYYITHEREHGTTMASIILHGDLNAPRPPLPHPLYVRPILRPDPQSWNNLRDERIPFGVNALDLTHRAVRRLFEAEAGNPAVAPNTKIINFSIGDASQPFHSAVSAWGRLLDWLSIKYNVLFCVSAGNHSRSIELNVERSAFPGLNIQQREAEVLKAILQDLRHRRILSPSDSINSITIGSWHHDYGPVVNVAYRLDPLHSQLLPSPINGLGCGFRSATKPDILFPGGRQFYLERPGNRHLKATLDVACGNVAPGILAASASEPAGQLDREKHTRGTSNATALATRSAAFLYEQLLTLREETGGERLTEDYTGVLLKGMLVHKANWGDAYDYLKDRLKPAAMREEKFRRVAARLLGFGFVEPFESLLGADHRATMIGCGTLADNAAHEYRIPLPPSLNGRRGLRRITITLAWLSPLNPRNRNYRGAALWFDVQNEKLATERTDAEWRSVRNGTVQHEIFEGESAASFADNDSILIKVNCRSDADVLANNVRYGLIVSLEVAEQLHIPVYQEISTRIRQQVPIGT